MPAQLLVVEDDVVLQLSLTTMLRRKGFSILTARGVVEARVQLLRERPALMLLDLDLSDGSGFEILEALHGLPDRPITLVLTASETMTNAIKALHMGAFDYLTKPINNDLLHIALLHAVEHERLTQAAHENERLRGREESLRDTARSVAHHLSQHLTVIMGETQLLQEELTDVQVSASLARILSATEQAAAYLATLRNGPPFAVNEAAAPTPVLHLHPRDEA